MHNDYLENIGSRTVKTITIEMSDSYVARKAGSINIVMHGSKTW